MNKALVQREEEIKRGLLAQQKLIKSLLLGDKEKSDKFLATASKVANDIKLANCTTKSIIDACVNVAQMGLDLSPVLNHAYLVPFKQKVQLIVSARGYTALLARTGWKVKSYIVNDADDFTYRIDGFEETIKFEKDLDAEKPEFKYAVAIAKSPDGTLYVEVMNKAQIEKHRLVSANQNKEISGIWKDWFEEMAKKTVLKKLVKSLPIGEQISQAIMLDEKPIDAEIEEREAPTSLNDMPLHNEETGEIIEEEIQI